MYQELTVGRIVHYYTTDKRHQSNGAGEGPYPAVVTQVLAKTSANLFVFPNHIHMAASLSGLVKSTVKHRSTLGDTHPKEWWQWPGEMFDAHGVEGD
jgi:hypothetical protein